MYLLYLWLFDSIEIMFVLLKRKSSQVYFFTQLPNLDLTPFKIDKSKIIIDDNFKHEVLQQIYNIFIKQKN